MTKQDLATRLILIFILGIGVDNLFPLENIRELSNIPLPVTGVFGPGAVGR